MVFNNKADFDFDTNSKYFNKRITLSFLCTTTSRRGEIANNTKCLSFLKFVSHTLHMYFGIFEYNIVTLLYPFVSYAEKLL